MKHLGWRVLAVAPALLLSSAWAKSTTPWKNWTAPAISGELGLLGSSGENSRVSERGRLYAEPVLRWRPSGESKRWSLSLSARAWGQVESTFGAQSRTSGLEIRDSYLEHESESARLRLGFQTLSWGETFGFFIADLPNPRDLRDPLLLEIAHIKKPVFMMQGQWFFTGGGGVQAFFTPIARQTDFPVQLPRRDFRRLGPDS